MIQKLKVFFSFLILFIFAANISAQNDFNNIDSEVAKTLLKKDLRIAITEAEDSQGNDIRSLLWRLNLYRRAANSEKFTAAVRQIAEHSEFEKSGSNLAGIIGGELTNPLFDDYAFLQNYLQKYGLYDKIYEKFFNFCLANKEKCDINGFDKWLEQQALKASETKNSSGYYFPFNPYFEWISRRIYWREKFGLDNSIILNQFVEDVRKNPTNFDAAQRYLKFFNNVQDINWLVETFVSEQAFDYYDLGDIISSQLKYGGLGNSSRNENERRQIYQIAAQLLQKSLTLPFNEKDTSLIWSRKISHTSIPPVLKNPEKQLRFWTKSLLAEVYKNAGEAVKAQPIVEELMNTDTSDILSSPPSMMAGAVQAQSGARVVESKILTEQAARQNSYQYWQERIAYYYGREENERMFDSYKQGLAAVPFELSNKNSNESRLHFIRGFADFAEDEFGYYGNSSNKKNFDEEENAKLADWLEAENFFRNEFEKTKSNSEYSIKLAEIIFQNEFKQLSDEILTKNPEIIVIGVKLDLLGEIDSVIYDFFRSEKILPEKKDTVFEQILKITEAKDVKKVWFICDVLNNIEPKYAAQLIPILLKNSQIARKRFIAANPSGNNFSEFENLKDKYLEVLFDTYLAANDWKSAEKLILDNNLSLRWYSLEWLSMIALKAAQNGAFEDAARIWKLKANIDRNDLENLSSLKSYPATTAILRAFYEKMREEEPYSSVPIKALAILY